MSLLRAEMVIPEKNQSHSHDVKLTYLAILLQGITFGLDIKFKALSLGVRLLAVNTYVKYL